MIRLANSSTLLSTMLGLGRQGDETANLVRTAALRTDRALKAAPAKTAEPAAKTSTARPAVTVSLSRMAQAAQAAQTQAAQAEPETLSAKTSEPERPKPPPGTVGQPGRNVGVSPFTLDEQQKLEAIVDLQKAQHRDYIRFVQERIAPNDVSSMTPADARKQLDDLSALPHLQEVQTRVMGWASSPFVFAMKDGQSTDSLDTYKGWLQERAQSEAAPPPTSGLDVQV